MAPFFGGSLPSSTTVLETQIVDGVLLARVASSETISGLWTFDRGANVPFAVASGSLNVPNLDADLLDGLEAEDLLDVSEELMFWNSD